jgi:hypothetical protein
MFHSLHARFNLLCLLLLFELLFLEASIRGVRPTRDAILSKSRRAN